MRFIEWLEEKVLCWIIERRVRRLEKERKFRKAVKLISGLVDLEIIK